MRSGPANGAGLALALLLLLTAFAGAAATAAPPDIKATLDASLDNAKKDREVWGRTAFTRHVTRQRLDSDDDVEWRQVMLFRVTPTADGFDEEIVEIDDAKPTAKLVAKHRKAGLFEKHYDKTDSVTLENPFGADLPLLPLLYDQEHVYGGESEVDGIPCYRMLFEARPDPGDVPVAERLKYAMKGELCISKEGSRLMHARIGTTREVKSTITIRLMEIGLEARPHEEAWLPTLFEMRSKVKAPLGLKFNTHNFYRYSDFRRVR